MMSDEIGIYLYKVQAFLTLNVITFRANAIAFNENVITFSVNAITITLNVITFRLNVITFNLNAITSRANAITFNLNATAFEANAIVLSPAFRRLLPKRHCLLKKGLKTLSNDVSLPFLSLQTEFFFKFAQTACQLHDFFFISWFRRE